MPKKLVLGWAYPLINERGRIHITPDNRVLTEEDKGVANGIASLGSDSKVPSSQLPSAGGGTLIETHIPLIQLATALTI